MHFNSSCEIPAGQSASTDAMSSNEELASKRCEYFREIEGVAREAAVTRDPSVQGCCVKVLLSQIERLKSLGELLEK
jgi:hypothetical protein